MREICAAEVLLSTQIAKVLQRKRTTAAKYSDRGKDSQRVSRLLSDQFDQLVSGALRSDAE